MWGRLGRAALAAAFLAGLVVVAGLWLASRAKALTVEPRMTTGTCFSLRVIVHRFEVVERGSFVLYRPHRALGRVLCCAPIDGSAPSCITLQSDREI